MLTLLQTAQVSLNWKSGSCMLAQVHTVSIHCLSFVCLPVSLLYGKGQYMMLSDILKKAWHQFILATFHHCFLVSCHFSSCVSF